MGFMDFLFNMFPHRWLKRDAPGTFRFFIGLGNVLDKYDEMVKQVEREADVRTAVLTLPEREGEYGLNIDPSLPLDVRRNRLIVRMGEEGGPTNKKDFEAALTMLLGAPTKIITYPNEHAVIYECENNGQPINISNANEYILRNKRAHVGHSYIGKILGEGIVVSGNVRNFDVTYRRCGETITEGVRDGQLAQAGVNVLGDAYGFDVPYRRCGEAYTGEEA
ncbi:putative phage tail protein [Aneurinibacillus aneurinilyticus]|jgi:hypothetical protein|uniref:putative phage tail protein n=1 Tax=Aneurinibacillus aneurinilyticus TaxID=1391 RepID=UPI0023F75BBB|nr:putative phage tail protein [Aneurinibacillus aneurinilyticus]MCI1696458.1 YmfQ family protein [Aneurinibacillus aneurinilyticus]